MKHTPLFGWLLFTVVDFASSVSHASSINDFGVVSNEEIHDYYFSTTATGTVTVDVSETLDDASDFDSRINLYFNDGLLNHTDWIAGDDDSGGGPSGLESHLSLTLSAGDYLVRVGTHSFAPSATGTTNPTGHHAWTDYNIEISGDYVLASHVFEYPEVVYADPDGAFSVKTALTIGPSGAGFAASDSVNVDNTDLPATAADGFCEATLDEGYQLINGASGHLLDPGQPGEIYLSTRLCGIGGRYSARVTIQPYGIPVEHPIVNADGVVNAASFSASVAAGSLASVFGVELSEFTEHAGTIPLPTKLGSGNMNLGSRASPQVFASLGQSNLQIPWELAGESNASIQDIVESQTGTRRGNVETVTLAAYSPGLFATNQSGTGQGAIQIANTTVLAAPFQSIPGVVARPANRGEYITIYCTGLGPVNNQPATGAAAADASSTTITIPAVTIGGIPASVSFSGLAPGFVGLYQVNAQVPESAPTNDSVPVILTIGGEESNTVTIAVQ